MPLGVSSAVGSGVEPSLKLVTCSDWGGRRGPEGRAPGDVHVPCQTDSVLVPCFPPSFVPACPAGQQVMAQVLGTRMGPDPALHGCLGSGGVVGDSVCECENVCVSICLL